MNRGDRVEHVDYPYTGVVAEVFDTCPMPRSWFAIQDPPLSQELYHAHWAYVRVDGGGTAYWPMARLRNADMGTETTTP